MPAPTKLCAVCNAISSLAAPRRQSSSMPAAGRVRVVAGEDERFAALRCAALAFRLGKGLTKKSRRKRLARRRVHAAAGAEETRSDPSGAALSKSSASGPQGCTRSPPLLHLAATACNAQATAAQLSKPGACFHCNLEKSWHRLRANSSEQQKFKPPDSFLCRHPGRSLRDALVVPSSKHPPTRASLTSKSKVGAPWGLWASTGRRFSE